MKKIVVVLVSLVVGVLIGVGNAFAQGKTSKASIPEPSLSPEWKLVFIASDGTTYYFNTRRITYLPKGIVKIWELSVPRGELRRTFVNILKNHLFWYTKGLDKINCKTHQNALLEVTAYSFEKTVLFSHSVQHEEWKDNQPGSPAEAIEKHVCNETHPSIPAQYKQTIPEPSLGPEWKLLDKNSNGTTLYVNTRKINYLPEGIVKVRELWVPRGEFRRVLVHLLKKVLLYEGKDPNNAERLWYEIKLNKINCKTHQGATLELTFDSFGKAVLVHHSFQHEEWGNIYPKSPDWVVEKLVCK